MRRALVLVGVLAFLVGLAFLVARPHVPDPAATPYAGVRGGAREKAAGLAVLYRRGGSELPLQPGTMLAGGDVLRFVFKGERPRYLELRVRDADGPVRTLFPEGPTTVAVRPGQTLPVDFAVGPAAGRVLVTALFSNGPRAVGAPADGETETVSLSLPKDQASP
jgi:hypothetical protein